MIQRRDIELGDDLPFTRKSWTVERVGWGLLGAAVLAGLLGFLGPGILSGARAEGPLTVEFDRSERRENPGELRVRLRGGARNLWIENRWLEDVDVQRVRPEPARVHAQPGWTVYAFEGAEEVDVRLVVEHKKAGRVKGRFGVSPERTVTVSQFVYP